MEFNRRGLLLGAGSLVLSPAVVRADMLMPVSARHIPILVNLFTTASHLPLRMRIRQPRWVHPSTLLNKQEHHRLLDEASKLRLPWEGLGRHFDYVGYYQIHRDDPEYADLKKMAGLELTSFDSPSFALRTVSNDILEMIR